MSTRNISINFFITWYATTLTTLVFFIFLLIYVSTVQIYKPKVHSFKLYAALPENSIPATDYVSRSDARTKIIEDFFQKHKSVLSAHSNTFVEIADKYNLDYRLLPAISMQESNGGKRVIKNSFNPFGYGIYGNKVKRFESWDKAIERVGRALREDYIDKGLTTPDTIMSKYTPPAVESGSWARGVNSFMYELL